LMGAVSFAASGIFSDFTSATRSRNSVYASKG
jgi:hypothetical protein